MAKDRRDTRAKAQWRSRKVSLLLTEVLRHMEVAPMPSKWAKIAEIMGESKNKYVEIMNGVKIARQMQASTANSRVEKKGSKAPKKTGKNGNKGAKSKKGKSKSKGEKQEESSESEECSDSEESRYVSSSSDTIIMSCSPPLPPAVVATLPVPKTSNVRQDNRVNIAVCTGTVHSQTTAPKIPTSPRILDSAALKTPEGQRTAHIQISKTVRTSFTPANNSTPVAFNRKNQIPEVKVSTQISSQAPPFKCVNNMPLTLRGPNNIPLPPQVQQKQGPYPWSQSYNNWNMPHPKLFYSQR